MKRTALIIAVTVLSSCALIGNNSDDGESLRAESSVSQPLTSSQQTGTQGSSASPSSDKDSVTSQQSKQVKINDLSADASEKTDQNAHKPTQLSENTNSLVLSNFKRAEKHSSPIREMFAFSQNASDKADTLISIEENGRVFIWDLRQKSLAPYQSIQLKTTYTAIAFNLAKLRLAVAYPDSIEIFSLVDTKPEYSLSRIRSRITSMDFDEKGETLLIGGADSVVYRWKFVQEIAAETIAARENSLQRYIGHASVISDVKFHPFGRVFISTDWYGGLSAWLIYEADRHEGEFDKNAFEGRLFSQDVNRVRGGRKLPTILEKIAFSKDGQFMFLTAEDGLIEMWQIRGFKQIAMVQAHKGSIYDIAMSTVDGDLATVGRDGHIKTWKVIQAAGATADVSIYALMAIRDIPMPNVHKLVYQDVNTVLAGSLDGSIVRVDVGSVQP